MSRIIVKNLPKSITNKKLEELFSSKGCITDLQLKYNKAGAFRQFAFIGFKTEAEAHAAKDFFNNSFINTSKIQVDICKNLADKPERPTWSKPQSFKDNRDEIKTNKNAEPSKLPKKKKMDDQEKDLMKDTQFKEFMDVHKDRKSKPVWTDAVDQSESEESGSQSEADEDEKEETVAELKTADTEDTSAGTDNKPTPRKFFNDQFSVKISNLPFRCKKKDIKLFFKQLKITSLRLPPKKKGFAYVNFKSEKDLKQALTKTKGFLNGHRIDVVKYSRKAENMPKFYESNQEENDKEKNEDLLAETGRIFVRNLCFSVAEEDIENLFKPFGPLAEVHVPIDFATKKGQGLAFVSFMFAEHAVKAFSELDGTIFQGRVLHLIPAKPKKEQNVDENETNYKKKKQAELKQQSGNSSNWNILFLGTNAVADIVAEKHNIEKSKLLSGDGKESVAVRMALAETEMVMENRKFLLKNGVQLDAFSQADAERSKTIIVVKHLPAKTSSRQIHELFSRHGAITRVIVPPSGLLALVEFDNPTEAKIAFKKLAYSRFGNLPLYLEWAPVGAVPEKPAEEDGNSKSQEDPLNANESGEKLGEKQVDKESPEDAGEPIAHTTVFVKNLNYSTTSEDLRNHFQECGPVQYASVSTKIDGKTGRTLSMGFGFVQFQSKKAAVYALHNMQHSLLDGHAVDLKFANRATGQSSLSRKKKYEVQKQSSAIILVKNIPFQSDKSEVEELFKQFGDLKSVRLPTKLGGSGEHRGFGFIEYFTKDNAKRAFDALCHSTHLLNRRLVLEWAKANADDVEHLRKRTAQGFQDGKRPKVLKRTKLAADAALAHTRYDQDDA